MNTCGTCKYFGPLEELLGPTNDWGEPDEPRNTRLHRCDLLKHLNAGCFAEVDLSAIAGVVDGSGYHATLCVSEEFGCNQWTAKEARSTLGGNDV